MANKKNGLQKKVSTIFENAPIPSDVQRRKAIVPLLEGNGKDTQRRKVMEVNLIRIRKNGEKKIFSISNSVTVIGRKHNCDLWIPVDSVSRKHCQINSENGAIKIKDLGSKNGTILNGIKIEEAIIQPGDWMQIGPVGLVFQIDGQPEEITGPAVNTKEKKTETKKEKPDIKKQTQDDTVVNLENSDITKSLDKEADETDILLDDSEKSNIAGDLLLDDFTEDEKK